MKLVAALASLLGLFAQLPDIARAQGVTPPPTEGPEILAPRFLPPAPAAPAEPSPSPAPSAREPDAVMPPSPELYDLPPLAAAGPGGQPAVVNVETTETAEPAARHTGLPSLAGSAGLFRTSSAELGPAGELRFALYGEYARASSFLVDGSRTRRVAGVLAASGLLLRRLELFGALLAATSRNDRCSVGSTNCRAEPDRTDPPVIRAFGDVLLGLKTAAPVTGPLHLGVEAGVRLYADSQGQAFDGDATSFWLSSLGTLDLRRSSDVPLRFHLNLGFLADNSHNLLDDGRFANASLPSRSVSSFAYGVGHSRARAALAMALPLERSATSLAWEPFIEYHAELVTDAADPAFAAYTPPTCRPGNPCNDNRDQHWLSFGIRAQAAMGLAVVAGVDLGLRSPGYAYGSQLLPYNLILGIGQALSLARPRTRVVTRTVTVERPVAAAPREGWLTGRVLGLEGQPVAGATVGALGASRGRVATDLDGGFISKGLPGGEVQVEISAPGFEPQIRTARVVPGQTTELQVALTVSPARVHGRVMGPDGRVVGGAAVRIEGPASADVVADAQGRFEAGLTPGAYLARVETPRGRAEQRFEVQPGASASVELTLAGAVVAPTAATAAAAGGRDLRLDKGRVVLRRPIAFRISDDQPTAELEPSARTALDELAAQLARHPEISQVRVEAHWDNGLQAADAEALTRRQAQAVVEHLVSRGIARERLLPAGLGASRPRVPNLGRSSRAQNRRVELRIAR